MRRGGPPARRLRRSTAGATRQCNRLATPRMSAQQAGQLLLLEAESLYCPDAGGVIDGGVTVAIRDGRILWRGRREALPAELHRNQEAATTVEFESSTMLAPGLVDLHCHCDPTGGEISRYGVDPDEVYLPRGVTTILSQGDAGADTWEAYARTTGGCRTRCLMAMNLLRAGEVPSYFEGRKGGEDLVDFDVAACVAAMRAGGQAVWGVDINTGHNHGPTHELREAAARAVAAAEATGTNILFGMRRPTDGWSFAQQLSMLREGDVVTCECEIPCTPVTQPSLLILYGAAANLAQTSIGARRSDRTTSLLATVSCLRAVAPSTPPSSKRDSAVSSSMLGTEGQRSTLRWPKPQSRRAFYPTRFPPTCTHRWTTHGCSPLALQGTHAMTC